MRACPLCPSPPPERPTVGHKIPINGDVMPSELTRSSRTVESWGRSGNSLQPATGEPQLTPCTHPEGDTGHPPKPQPKAAPRRTPSLGGKAYHSLAHTQRGSDGRRPHSSPWERTGDGAAPMRGTYIATQTHKQEGAQSLRQHGPPQGRHTPTSTRHRALLSTALGGQCLQQAQRANPKEKMATPRHTVR